MSTIAGVESCTCPKNSRHTVRIAGGIRCRMKRALTITPSQPSFCTPGSPARNLSVTSLPSPILRNCAPGTTSVSVRLTDCPSAERHASSNVACGASWILPRLWSTRVTSSHSASGVTMRHDSRLSSAVPHSTAFLPPALIATSPPMHDAAARQRERAARKASAAPARDDGQSQLDAALHERAHFFRAVRMQHVKRILDPPVGGVGDVRHARQAVEGDVLLVRVAQLRKRTLRV